MERFNCISFGLDLGIISQGMQNDLCYHTLTYKKMKLAPKTCNLTHTNPSCP